MLYIHIYNNQEDFTFDRARNERNVAARGMSFERAMGFALGSTLIDEDLRRNYGERQFQALV